MGLPDLDRRTVLATFERALATDPDGVAQIDRAGRWSTAEAFARSRRIGGGLAALGVRVDTPVGLMVDNSFDATHTWMGLALLGAVQVPVNTAYRGTFLAHVLHDSGVEILVLEAGYAERVAAVADALPRVRTLVVHGDVEQARAALPPGRFDVVAWPELEATREADPVRRGPGDLMAIMYTSGTTGRAKGVLVPHAHAYTYASREDQERPRRGDRSLVTLPTFHLAGQWYGVYQALIHTIACVLEPGFSVSAFWATVREHRISYTTMLGAMAELLAQRPPTPDEADNPLELAIMAPLASDVGTFRRRFNIELAAVYGMSEVGAVLNGPPDTVVGGEAGFPREGYQLRLVDSDGEPVGPGSIGELQVRPDLPHTVMAGYHGLPDATARTVIDGWVHTGDAFRTDAEGRWFFTDRMKDALRRRGENISSFEVESTVNEHPDVYESAVVAVPADVGEDEIKVVVVPQEGAAIDREQLTRFLIDRLPYFMVPRYVELADALPKTPTHKVQKAVLRDRGLDGDVWDREAAGIVLRRTTPGRAVTATRLLVANRGEIALRILTAAAGLGIATVAVHPADDRTCAHVSAADEAVELPGTGPAAYLDVDAVVDAARRTGADALHPGYGFLSENPALARACAAAGVTFVGPDPEVLALFGDKARAREHARSFGVDVLDATEPPTSPEDALAFLTGLGPWAAVMVKAVSGGGGRGLRVVRDADSIADAVARASSEAAAAGNDPAVFVERFLPHARHVEVQVAVDSTGAGAVLSDRDCSAQRRHQKLVEIAPAPGLAPGMRARLHDAARRVVGPVGLRGVATVEFLVDGDTLVFLEVNPRLQVEHTVTEEILGVDLVAAQLLLAGGASMREAGLDPVPAVRGTAVQARVCTETLGADATVTPQAGTLERFTPPTGRGVRVDTHGYAGYTVSPRYDSLLAKVVVHDPAAGPAHVAAQAVRALGGFDVAGVATNLGVLQALLARPELAEGRLDTGFVDRHAAELAAAPPSTHLPARSTAAAATTIAPEEIPDDAVAVRAPTAGVVVAVEVDAGSPVRAGASVVVLEAMKMEHVVTAGEAGVVVDVRVEAGDEVAAGALLATLRPGADDGVTADADDAVDPEHVRADLTESLERHRVTRDEARPESVRRRRTVGRRTARENVDDLVDAGSFVEYGALAIAAQRRRRSVDELIAKTPADGIVTGTATVGSRRVAVLAYDYTVLAGTQGLLNHAKTDRLLRLALDHRLPVVLFAEGGGGRPGDTDTTAVSSLDVPTFALFAQLSGRVPTVAVVAGYCFAGNAALAGCADLVVGTRDLSLGMGGPAMIEGGGLGRVAPDDVGPAGVQGPNGVVDVLVDDEAAAVGVARYYLGLTTPTEPPEPHDQRLLRAVVPENRLRVYDVRRVVRTLADPGSVLELREQFGVGMVTAFARLGGRAVGVLANDPRHLGGAIDADGADKAARFLQLCDARGLPVVSLCDTPGFMVGPDAERTATVRHFSRMFVAGANARIPLVTVVLRKGYGLGAMAMAGGHMHRPVLTVAWPTGEFGGMGLEGAVHLGYRDELAALDGAARRARYDALVAGLYEQGKGLSTATAFEIDDVIDPADTRTVVLAALDTADSSELPPRHAVVDPW